ncbi:ATP-binding protein [Pengzhenrongella sicca]|uniref:AAA family ATPase n=1 Tax=Pengzhenrongella sicca TaxID=2819238 RepID=A0A8A4ZEM4_9MICO|nr:ATP-binding protein [Pengzhenrongella sicca]QTE30354.1 AAA family ATPase [Pengzhenrongella sicca]
MDRSLNPYNPGAGLRPPALVGREAEIEAFDATVARTRLHMPNRGMVLSGLRGVGKTVLLNDLRGRAEQMGWFVAAIEGQRGEQGEDAVRRKLGRELLIAGRQLNRRGISKRLRTALGSITSFSVGVTGISLDVSAASGRADSGDLETDIGELVEDLAEALKEKGLAFALFIDEMQDLDQPTLSALLAAQHEAGQRERPFYIIGAGLPSLPAVLSEARSYAERLFDYRRIGALPNEVARKALREPAKKYGSDYEPGALDLLVDAAEGYPYFLQEYGRAIWDIAPNTPFTCDDAAAAVAYGLARLDEGFFRARWDRATPAERRLLHAMAQDDGAASNTTSVAERLGKKLSGIGPARAHLISKGLIYAPDHGMVAYTVPGMAPFIRRQHEAAASGKGA